MIIVAGSAYWDGEQWSPDPEAAVEYDRAEQLPERLPWSFDDANRGEVVLNFGSGGAYYYDPDRPGRPIGLVERR
jgi:hypothetical protein